MRIEDLLRRNARRTPDATAIVCEHEVLTWAELESRANRLANALRAGGYREHERIAVVLPNCHHIPIAYFAIWKCNMVNVAINPRLTTSEMQRILEHCGAAAVVCDSDAAVAAASATSSVRGIYTTGEAQAGATTVASLIEESDDTPASPMGVGTDLRSIRYTSGTTGHPKGCMATHEQQLASVSNFLIEVEVPRSAPTYLSVPMTLGVGAFYLTASAYLGVPLFIRRRFDPRQFLLDVEEHQIAHAFLVPTMLVDLAAELATRATPLSTPLTMIGYGGAQISWDVIRTLGAALGCELYQGLGATEAGGYATLLTPHDHAELLAGDPSGSTPIGRAAAYARTRIVDPEGQDVEPGDRGNCRTLR